MRLSRPSPSADSSHLEWIHRESTRQHHQDRDDHSDTDPEGAARLVLVPDDPDQYTAIFMPSTMVSLPSMLIDGMIAPVLNCVRALFQGEDLASSMAFALGS